MEIIRKYRIKEVNGKFIPQVRIWTALFYSWEGIDLNSFKTWFSEGLQYQYCSHNTIEEAKKVIEQYKPKYHKL